MTTHELNRLLDRFRSRDERITVKGPPSSSSDTRLDAARRKVQAHPSIPIMRAAKSRLISATASVKEDLDKVDEQYRSGRLTDVGYREQRGHLKELLRQAIRQVLADYASAEEELLRDLRPEVRAYPASLARERLEAYMLTEAALTPQQVLSAVSQAAEEDDLPFLQAVLPVVEKRARETEHSVPGKADPLLEAVSVIKSSLRTVDVRAGELAHALAPAMAGQLEVLVRQIEDRGSFSGPAATMRPPPTDLFPVVTEEEKAVHGDGADFGESLTVIQESIDG